jgi:hypothetical protein
MHKAQHGNLTMQKRDIATPTKSHNSATESNDKEWAEMLHREFRSLLLKIINDGGVPRW